MVGSTRRRVRYSKQQPRMMSRLRKLPGIIVIPFVTGVITLVGFYYATNETLSRYGEEIKSINSKIESGNKLIISKADEDSTSRSKTRDDFLVSQIKTNEGIAKLDSRLAVAESQQTIANKQLEKISDSL